MTTASLEIMKILLTAHDSGGRELSLVRLGDGRWSIMSEGVCQAIGWPDGQLAPAAHAYRDMVGLGRAASR